MHYTYVLKSEIHGKQYIGSTVNIGKRIKEHNEGKVRSTKAYRPYRLIYVEKFQTATEARKRENFLKSGVGRKILKEIVSERAEGCESG